MFDDGKWVFDEMPQTITHIWKITLVVSFYIFLQLQTDFLPEILCKKGVKTMYQCELYNPDYGE